MKAVGQIQAFLGNSDQHIGADRDPYLRLDSVLAGTKEGLDPQMLLDPLEEQLDLPSLSIQVGNHGGFEREIVGQKGQALALVVSYNDSTQSIGVVLAGVVNSQHANLIAKHIGGGAIDRLGVTVFELCVRFGSGDKERAALMDGIKPGVVEVATIQQVVSTRLDQQLVERVDLVSLAVAEVDKGWNRAPEIEQRVQFDGGLVLTKRCPRIHRQTQLDSRRIECVHGGIQIDGQRFVGVERSSNPDQVLRKVGIDLPGSRGVRIGQRVARHRAAPQTQVIKPARVCSQIQFDIAQRLPVSQLRKQHHEKLIETREVFDLVVAAVAVDAPLKGCLWQQRSQLRKNEFALVHGSPLHSDTKDHTPWYRRSNRHQAKSPKNQGISLTYGVLM